MLANRTNVQYTCKEDSGFIYLFIGVNLILLLKLWSGRIPVRLYVRNFGEDIDDLEDVTTIDSWDKVSYINHPVEIHREEGMLKTSREKTVSCYDKNCHD